MLSRGGCGGVRGGRGRARRGRACRARSWPRGLEPVGAPVDDAKLGVGALDQRARTCTSTPTPERERSATAQRSGKSGGLRHTRRSCSWVGQPSRSQQASPRATASTVPSGSTANAWTSPDTDPRVWDHVRREADASGEAGQFLLTGSSSPVDDARRHSGAGRIATVRMRPMTLHELGASSDEVSLAELFAGSDPAASDGRTDLRDVLDLIVTGGWPQQLQRSVVRRRLPGPDRPRRHQRRPRRRRSAARAPT